MFKGESDIKCRINSALEINIDSDINSLEDSTLECWSYSTKDKDINIALDTFKEIILDSLSFSVLQGFIWRLLS